MHAPRLGLKADSRGAAMPDIPLGIYTTVGGNRCVASVRVDKAAMVTVSFAWKSTPTADDREEWSFTILADAIHGTHRGSVSATGRPGCTRRSTTNAGV
jgi:hypothetical protein